ncbi:MAG: tRNA lysidine(34) synthetase TilS [Actinomycetia bacterium]|nr:tRNA lysidine(34) synthetase TilS [Actinomycetes bacterium]
MYEHPLIDRVREDLRRERWLPPQSAVVAGVSGGRDSMALAAVLVSLAPEFRWELVIAHVHHGLRGDEADQDAAFVEAWADRWHVPFRLLRVAVDPAPGQSLEMAAREARHRALAEVARPLGGRIALGHHLDDQAETVLLRLLRGTGVGGLAAMRPVHGPVVRPLLGYPRAVLTEFLAAVGVPWREDATNADVSILRNRVRHRLLPLLAAEYNPRVVEALGRLARSAAELDDWAQQEAGRWYAAHKVADPDAGEVRLVGLLAAPPAVADRVMRLAAAELGFALTEEQLDRARAGPTVWPRHHTVEHQGQDLVVAGPTEPVAWPAAPVPVAVPGTTPLPRGRLVVAAREGDEPAVDGGLRRLWVRGWRPGDRITLTGGQRKKLQDLFVDHKIPRRLRGAWPVVTADRGGETVVAVPGVAVDARAAARRGAPGWRLRWERGA